MSIFDKESEYKSSDFRSRNYTGSWANHFINEYLDSLFSIGTTSTQEKYSKFKNEHLPKFLYKFYSPNIFNLINIQNRTLHLSNPRNFNDPFDSYVCIETETFVKQSLLKKLKEQDLISSENVNNKISVSEYYEIVNSLSNDEFAPNSLYKPKRSFSATLYCILKRKNEEFRNLVDSITIEDRSECLRKVDFIRNLNFRISCFSYFNKESELLRNSTMWSHYADNHKGFCVKYSLDFENVKNKNVILCGLSPVKYTSRVAKLAYRDLMKLSFHNDELKLPPKVLKVVYKALINKSRFWSYENEWRLIIDKHNSEVLLNDTIPFFKIDSIYLGCRINRNIARHLILFSENENINIFQTRQSNEKFELETLSRNVERLLEDEFYEKLKELDQIKDISEMSEMLEKRSILFKEYNNK